MIDSHCHLADEVFQDDLEAVIERARGAGVDGALCVLDATNEAEAVRAARVAALWPAVRFAVGVHPHQAGVFADRLDDVEAHLRAAVEARAGTCAAAFSRNSGIGRGLRFDNRLPRRAAVERGGELRL